MKTIEIVFLNGKARSIQCNDWWFDEEDDDLSIEKIGGAMMYVRCDQWVSVEEL